MQYQFIQNAMLTMFCTAFGPMHPADIEDRARQLCHAFEHAASHLPDSILEHLAPDAEFYIWGMRKPPSVEHEAQRRDFTSLAGVLEDFRVTVKSLAVTGNTVLVEREETFVFLGRKMSLPVVGVGEVNERGKFTVWKDYFDPTEMDAAQTGA
ncbi:Limonene-1,2-epoxide hydrolase catalytic domain-containing protein [Cladophialophora immunda]|nr:Limonene-1,2-epoxide hydrolase catalytic domain-containing protein [Cladophialophora immunda]